MSQNKRRYPRQPAPGFGLVDVFRVRTGGKVQALGRTLLEDISRGGLGIQMDNRVPIGEKLYLQNRFISCAGQVCYCARTELGYKIGLQFLQNVAPITIKAQIGPDGRPTDGSNR